MRLRESINAPGIGEFSFEFHFQPKVCLRQPSRRVVGHEALLRLRFKDAGVVGPGAFFAALKRSEGEGLALRRIMALAALDHAIEAAKILRCGIAINIDPCLLADGFFLDRLESRPPPNPAITLEIIEAATPARLDAVAKGVCRARSAGYRVALDDFGMAESNMIRLVRLMVDEVKIDALLLDHARGRAMLPHIVLAIHAVGAEACIEGVETIEHHLAAAESGAGAAQGFFYGPPGPIRGV